MTKNSTVEKIDDIITKIEEVVKSEEDLETKKVKKLLYNIEDELTELENSAEGKNKEKVEEKVKEMKGVISKGIKNHWEWERVKDALNDDIKDELKELKGKLTESEIPAAIIVTESKVSDEIIDFYKKEIEELKEKLRKTEEERDEYRNKLEVKEKEVIKLTYEGKEKKSFNERVVKDAYAYIKDGAETGAEIGSKIFPVIGPAIGGYSGVGVAAVGALFNAGADTLDQGKEVYEETLNVGAKLAEKTGDNLTDVTKNVSDNVTEVTKGITKEIGETLRNAGDNATKLAETAAKYADTTKKLLGDLADTSIHATVDTVENFRKGGENLIGKGMDNTTSVINESIGVVKAVVETKAEVKLGGLKIELGDRKGEVMEATVGGKDEIIKNQKETIERLEREIQSLRKQVEKQSERGESNLLSVIEIMAKSSQTNTPYGSRPNTPPPYNKQ